MLSLHNIGFVGGGQMAEALIRGLLDAGIASPEAIMVAEPHAERREVLAQRYGVACTTEAEALCRVCPILLAAIKPQIAQEVLSSYNQFVTKEHLILSIMAGLALRTLAGLFAEPVRLIRAMPNTPALVLAGATAFAVDERATDQDRRIAEAIFSSVGTWVEVTESQLDAVTGLSGSGPGYVMTFIEALIDGGVLAGLPRPTAERLVLQTVYGSAKLALDTGEHPAVLKGRVTSPGGTTIAGIQALENGALRGVVMAAVEAATERSRELGGV